MARLGFRESPLTMLSRRRRLSVAVLFLFAAAPGTPLAAQQTNTSAPATSTTVGPPQLKDFHLPGTRTTPPPPQTPPVTQPQPTRTSPPATTAPAPTPRTTGTQPQRQARPATRPPATRAPAAAPQTQAPATTIPAQTAPPPSSTAPVSPLPLPAPAARPPAPAPSSSSLPWLPIGGGLLLALLGFLGMRRFAAMRAAARKQKQREARAAERAAAAEAKAIAEAETEAARAAAEAEAAAARAAAAALPRARLELGFVPDRAIATESETIVHYDLILRNVGRLPARNIRIDGSMFNASAEAEIGDFLKGPIHEISGSPQVQVAPGAELKLASAIAMPKENVRGINVQGHSIFVPVVAIIVAYDWGPAGEGGGSGRTSQSWLVGREPQTPSDKMGAFRLDAGPRVYRSVGQRPTELAHVA